MQQQEITMKTKYIINAGLAFSENKEIKKLEKMAADGWIFQKFAWGGFFYKLLEGPKQELTYTMDYQSNPDTEYFQIFNSAGWHHVSSSGNQIHVFSAPKGTPPIYSGNEIDEGKYQDMTSAMGKGSIYSFIILITSFILLKISKANFEFLFWPLSIVMILTAVVFVFCFMPYVAYKYKEKKNTSLSKPVGNGDEENL